MDVRDLLGRAWVVRRTFAPWWRVVQPFALIGGEYRRRRPVPPTPAPRKSRRLEKEEKADAGTVVAGVVLVLLGLPEMLFHLLLFVLAWPLVALELLAMGLAGCLLHVLRTARLVRHRVDVLGMENHRLHSLTVLLVRGGRRHANALVRGIATTLAESNRAYVPEKLPTSVTVASRNGFWS